MRQAQAVKTRFPTESGMTAENVRRLSELINEVYDDAESGMWKREGTRTNPAEVERLLRADALILAEIDGAAACTRNGFPSSQPSATTPSGTNRCSPRAI
jgi:hypothetical protein